MQDANVESMVLPQWQIARLEQCIGCENCGKDVVAFTRLGYPHCGNSECILELEFVEDPPRWGRVKRKKAPLNYERMAQSVECCWCWACGRDDRSRPDNWHAPWRLERCHLASGSGRMLRKQDRRQVNLLCSRCHLLHSGNRIIVDGAKLPRITDGAMLWTKRAMDSDFWDEDFIEVSWTGRPPDLEPLDEWFLDEYRQRRGEHPGLCIA